MKAVQVFEGDGVDHQSIVMKRCTAWVIRDRSVTDLPYFAFRRMDSAPVWVSTLFDCEPFRTKKAARQAYRQWHFSIPAHHRELYDIEIIPWPK